MPVGGESDSSGKVLPPQAYSLVQPHDLLFQLQSSSFSAIHNISVCMMKVTASWIAI